MWHFNFESRRSTLTAFALSLLLPSAVLGSESAVRTFPDGTPSDRRHPQAPPIKLAADDWIYLKLPRPGAAYEALASSPNGVVLFRNFKNPHPEIVVHDLNEYSLETRENFSVQYRKSDPVWEPTEELGDKYARWDNSCC
jgi:hypothetical protein